MMIFAAWLLAQADPAWIETRIQELQPRPEEKKFDTIGRLTEIRPAEELARRHGRPLFLFTHDGVMATDRC